MSEATKITRRAKSNLAFALHILPRERRKDMVVFYAFCRSIDDLADDLNVPEAERAKGLDAWKSGLESGFENPGALEKQVLELRERRSIPTELLTAIIDGCRMDLHPENFQTWDELASYIWHVACAVGLVSVKLFGCKDPAAETYAIALASALQLTNILRDIGEDLDNGGRVYLPLEDLARFGYSLEELQNRTLNPNFQSLMRFEADRAEGFFREAAEALPAADRRALAPARIMGEIYHQLLERMRRDGFKVFEKRYHVPKIRKLAILSKHLIAG